MKKICICTTVSLTMKSFIIPTAKYLYEKCGYDITLICNDDKEFAKMLPDYIHYIPVHMSRGIDVSAYKSILSFVKIFRREKFDMVQYSTPNASCYASIAAKVCRIPIRLYCQWGIRYVGLQGIGRKIFKFIEKIICENSTDIRAVSPLNREFAISEGLYKTGKAKVIGHGGTIGVDLDKYDIRKKSQWKSEIRTKYRISNRDFVFGFSGRISIDKGCGELFAAFRKLEEKGMKAKLLIVGPVDDNCEIDQNLISWAKNSGNVIMTGKVEGNSMCKYYAAMDVLVHPTYREGFGMVIQEAGALGIPVVTTNIPGASEVMEDGISAIHIEARNVDQLANAMWDLKQDLRKTKFLGQNAYKRTMELYDRDIMLEFQRVAYEQLLGD